MVRVSTHKSTKSAKYPQHVSKPAQKSKSKSRRSSIVSPTKTPRGPVLVTYFPTVEEMENDDDPAQVPRDEKEFRKRYTPYAKMKVFKLGTSENVFGDEDELIQINDFVQIRAGEIGGRSVEETEKWHAQVREIGARKEPGWAKEDVCLQVAWFYTHEMLADRALSKEDRKLCGNMMENELIPSDHLDIVHLSSIMAKVDVMFFNEHSQHQAEIDADDFFYRRRLMGDRILMSKDTCTTRCKAPYHPSRDVQHYCPRDQCHRWYHTSCMTPNKHNPDDYRLVGYNITSVEQLLVDLVSSKASKKKSKHKINHPYPITNPSSETEPEEETPQMSVQAAHARAQLLPSRIRTLATLSITRGIRSGNGVVGNVWVVVMARWLARQVIVEGKPLDKDDADQVETTANNMNAGNGPKLTPLEFECPGCGSPI